MQLAILIAVLAALASAESGGGPVAGVAWRLLIVTTAMLVAPLAALVGTQKLVAAIESRDPSEQALAQLQSVVLGLWMSGVAAMLFIAHWPQIVRDNWRLSDWPLLDEIAILAPVIAPLVLMWAVYYRLERAAQLAVYRIRNIDPPRSRMSSFLWFQVRHHLGLILVPPLAVVGVIETFASLKIATPELNVGWWFVAPLAAMCVVLLPAVVRRIWLTTPLPAGPLRDLLLGVSQQQKCPVGDILIWNTGDTMANAAVVGLSRWLRYMLLSDLLLRRLTAPQLAAVARHELAHLRRWHLPLRLALLLAPVTWWMALGHIWPGLEAWQASRAAAFVIPFAMLAYAVIVVGWYSRMLEHDADLGACLSGDSDVNATAAADLCGALIAVCGGTDGGWLQWLHPPLEKRLRFLREVVHQPETGATLRHKLQRVGMAIALAHVAAVIVLAL